VKETVCASIPDPPAVGNSGRIGNEKTAPVAAVKLTVMVVSGAVSIALKALEPIINAAIKGINGVIRAKNLLTPGPDTPTISPINFTSGGAFTGSNTVAPGGLPFGGSVPGKPEAGGGGNLIAGGITGGGTSGGGTSGTPNVGAGTIVFPSGSSTAPFTSIAGSTFNPSAARAGEERDNVIINVNAPSVIDEEGFTRAVVLALNNSTNRGTTGAGDLRFNAQIL